MKTDFDGPLHPSQQSLVIIAEEVRGHHHHTLEAVQPLHQHVAVSR